MFGTDNYQDDGHGHEILVVPFDLVRTLAFLSYMSKIFLYYNRNREIEILRHQLYELGYGKSRHNLL